MIIKKILIKNITDYTQSKDFTDKVHSLCSLYNENATDSAKPDTAKHYINKIKIHKLYINILQDIFYIIKNSGYSVADLPDWHDTQQGSAIQSAVYNAFINICKNNITWWKDHCFGHFYWGKEYGGSYLGIGINYGNGHKLYIDKDTDDIRAWQLKKIKEPETITEASLEIATTKIGDCIKTIQKAFKDIKNICINNGLSEYTFHPIGNVKIDEYTNTDHAELLKSIIKQNPIND